MRPASRHESGACTVIRLIEPHQMERAVDILAHAYPGSNLFQDTERERAVKEMREEQAGPPTRRHYGVYRGEELVGTMRLLDFRMNLYGRMVDAGGVGGVAVDFAHKKERVAKELLEGFLHHYRARSTAIVLLYAFRTDFYRQMGFGMGPQMYRYTLPPARFPKGPSKAHIVHLRGTERDKAELKAFYHAQVRKTHGLIERTDAEVDEIFSPPGRLVMGYRTEAGLSGYLIGTFSRETPHNSFSNTLVVREFFYNEPTVLAEFLAFLHSQADQLRHVIFDTEDPYFYHVIPDARSPGEEMISRGHDVTNLAAASLLYRVIDTRKLFEDLREHQFGRETVRVRFRVDDSFLPENGGPFLVAFRDGYATWGSDEAPADVDVRMDISTFSSVVMGALPFRTAHAYGHAVVSNAAWMDVLDRVFASPAPPICTTDF